MVATALAALLAGSDAVPAAVLDGWLAAAEEAYTHAEADGRFTVGRPGRPPDQTADERYVGSWRRGHALYSDITGETVAANVRLWVVNPDYAAMAFRRPEGWVISPTYMGTPGRVTLHPHAPCGLPGDSVSYRELLRRRTGARLTLTAAARAGRPVWAAAATVAAPPERLVGPTRLTLVLSADLRPVVLAAHTDCPDRPTEGFACEVEYAPAADDWPALRTVRVTVGDPATGPLTEQVAVFSRYVRLADPPPGDQFTLAVVGLPSPDGSAESNESGPTDPDEPGPPERWHWWAIGGILLAGVVAFVRVGRAEGSPAAR